MHKAKFNSIEGSSHKNRKLQNAVSQSLNSIKKDDLLSLPKLRTIEEEEKEPRWRMLEG